MKKLFALLLAITMMLSLSVTAFAAEIDQDTAAPQEGSIAVSYQVAPTYTVTIPATVTLGETAKIEVENVVVEKGKQVEVALTNANDFKVATPEGAELTYTVKNGETEVAEGETVLAVNPKDGTTGETTLSFVAPTTIQYAGKYEGTVTFTVAVKDVPVTIISFTIDGASYQAEEGMTWAEWVADPACNTVGLEKDGEWYIVDPSTDKAVFKAEWETCNPSDVIVADYEYYLDWIME